MTLPAMLYLIQFWSAVNGLDPKIAIAVASQESKFNVNATGSVGEVGLYQLRPQYFKKYTKMQLYDPSVNIMVGVKRLTELKKKFKNKKGNAFLAAYNCGEAGAAKLMYPEKFKYVEEVNQKIASMR